MLEERRNESQVGTAARWRGLLVETTPRRALGSRPASNVAVRLPVVWQLLRREVYPVCPFCARMAAETEARWRADLEQWELERLKADDSIH
jgi:hypothetical protein